MYCDSENICIFEVRTQLINHEATHFKTTETKTKGRRTVESTAVNSMPRIDWVRSDLPHFTHFKSFIMRTQNDEKQYHSAEAAELAVMSFKKAKETPESNNLYVHSLMKAFKEFLIEESQGCIFTELRLMDKIEASRKLFPEDKQQLVNITRTERRV